MAIFVHYFENPPDSVYAEGPFVYTDAGGYRIEVQLPGYYCPVLLHQSIYNLLEREGRYFPKTTNRDKAIDCVDWLNELVKQGRIVCISDEWVVPT